MPDPLLSSFVGHFVEVDSPKDAPQELLDETKVGSDALEQKAAERYGNLFTFGITPQVAGSSRHSKVLPRETDGSPFTLIFCDDMSSI